MAKIVRKERERDVLFVNGCNSIVLLKTDITCVLISVIFLFGVELFVTNKIVQENALHKIQSQIILHSSQIFGQIKFLVNTEDFILHYFIGVQHSYRKL